MDETRRVTRTLLYFPSSSYLLIPRHITSAVDKATLNKPEIKKKIGFPGDMMWEDEVNDKAHNNLDFGY